MNPKTIREWTIQWSPMLGKSTVVAYTYTWALPEIEIEGNGIEFNNEDRHDLNRRFACPIDVMEAAIEMFKDGK